MEKATVKPPWETVQFQTSPLANEALVQTLLAVSFSEHWNELAHDDLNKMKQQIEPLEQDHKWENLKKRTNLYELIYTQESTECPQSISLFKPLSRSFFKMIEILHILKFFERLPKQTQRLRSAHVAEGPGGFIEALFHRAEGHRLGIQRALAMTLKPVNHHIPGWRRTFPFLHKHPEIKIYYGSDNTGDILKECNQAAFVEQCNNQRVHLFTGDGGFDFSIDYENQERTVFPLLIASAIIGVQVLGPDGSFVLKIFDCFSESTQYLIRLITLFFREWTLYKPAASRPCNSERYLLCNGFRTIHQPLLLEALKRLQAAQSSRQPYPVAGTFAFFSEKEKEFLQQHIQYYHANQIDILKETIDSQSVASSAYSWKPHYKHSLQWCSYFRIPTVPLKSIEANLV